MAQHLAIAIAAQYMNRAAAAELVGNVMLADRCSCQISPGLLGGHEPSCARAVSLSVLVFRALLHRQQHFGLTLAGNPDPAVVADRIAAALQSDIG